MKRQYTSGTTTNVTLFIGTEVEKTPAYQMKTLFVVGLHDYNDLLVHKSTPDANIEHLYFGANQSFNSEISDVDLSKWVNMITPWLDNGIWCTLDFDVSLTDKVLSTNLCSYRHFIPQISVKIPNLQNLGYNATLKIDDVDFDATNPGVWCHRLSELLSRDKFTNWDQYGTDSIIKQELT